MGYRFDVFVGSDNSSRRIDHHYLGRVVSWASSVFPNGYTLTRSRGYFEGTQEDSLILSVISNEDIDLTEKVTELKSELRQKSIIVSKYSVQLETV